MKRLVFLAVLLVFVGSVCADITTGLVNWWKCDDGAGSVVTDCVSGLNGSISNLGTGSMEWEDDSLVFYGKTSSNATGVTFDTGAVTSAFAAFDKQITCSWSAQFRDFYYNNETVSLLSSTNGRVLHVENCTGYWPQYPTNKHNFAVTAGDPDKVYYYDMYTEGTANYIPLLNVWHQFAVTKDTDSGYIKIYVDGELKAFGTDKTTSLAGGANLTIGLNNFTGAMKDIRIYNRELSAADIAELVPEPATIVMLGLGGIALIRRKRN